MARVEIPLTVTLTNGDVSVGASVTIRKRSDNSLATVYAAETGGTTVANPLATDSYGRVNGWVDRNTYVANITGGTPAVVAYNENFDATPAGDGTIDAAWMADAVLPLGSIMDYAGSADPSGGMWVIADGRAISRTTYASLFAKIATTYGVGDGSTTFNLPDFRGRVALGKGTASPAVAGGTDHLLAEKGGEEKHTLTTGEMPSHSHTESIANPGTGSGTGAYVGGTNIGLGPIGTNPTGGGSSHNTLPPYTAVNKIIRIL